MNHASNKTELNQVPQGLLTRGQVASLFGVCKETIRRWERQGSFKPVIMNSRVLRYRPADIHAVIAQN
jgi:DNA-binding transcriptional MerR regulator